MTRAVHAHAQGPAMDPATPRLRPTAYAWPIFGWEYHEAVLTYDKLWHETLNRLGLEGWDLISVIHDESTKSSDKGGYAARVLFKRPRAELPNEDELRELGFKNPQVFTTWLEEAREAYAALVSGSTAKQQGRVVKRDATQEDDDG